MIRFRDSIRGKVILLASLVSFFTAVFVGGFYFFQMKEVILENSIDNLAGETRLINLRFNKLISQMKDDIFLISKPPPINGMIRSEENNGIDPFDNSTYEEWQNRLSIIFKSVMESRKHYTQMRFIGIKNNGKEIVRVNRVEGGHEIVSSDNLQFKNDSDYYKDVIGRELNEVQFSKVTYNKEYGMLEPELIPTLRAYYPIKDSKGELYGFIIVNTDYQELIKKGLDNFDPNKDVLIVNQSGDYMLYNHVKKTASFEFHKNYTTPPPSYIQKINHLKKNEAVFFEEDHVVYTVKLPLPGNDPDAFIGIALKAPTSVLLEEAYYTGYKSIILSAILILISLIITIIIVNKFTKPWEKLTNRVLSIETFDRPIEFSIDCNDEVGKLAAAFQTLAKKFFVNKSLSKLVLENVIDGIIIFDEDGKIQETNPTFDRIFKISKGEAIGNSLYEMIPSFKNHLGKRFEAIGKRKDGSEFPVELAITKIELSGNIIYNAFIRDITEIKANEKKIIAANKEYESLTYIASHDLRSPLINLKGFSSEIKEYIDEMEPYINRCMELISTEDQEKLQEIFKENIPEAVGFIQNGVERIDMMTNAMLTLSRTGRMELHFNQVNTQETLKKCVRVLAHQIQKKGIELQVGKLPEIYADQLATEQIFTNLLDNSLKYLSPDRKGKIEISCVERDAHFEFTFKDNGRGIAEKDFEKVFAIFRRASNVVDTKGEGMGLSFVKKLIERHGGEMKFTSTVDQETSFIFTISKDLKVPKTGHLEATNES